MSAPTAKGFRSVPTEHVLCPWGRFASYSLSGCGARQRPEVSRLHPLERCDEAEWAVWSAQFCETGTLRHVVETVCMGSNEGREASPALLAVPVPRKLARRDIAK